MDKNKTWIVLVALLLVASLGWAYWSRGDAQVAKVAELQEKAFANAEKASPEDRRKAFEELRTEAEKLTDDQRAKMMRDNPPPFMKQFQKSVNDYFALSEADRVKALDKQIDEWEKRRKDWEARRAKGEGPGGKGGGGFAGGGPPPGGGPGGGGPPGGGGRGGMMNDPARQAAFRKSMLDNTTPQQRAMFGEYMSQMEQRRKERGLPPGPGPRF